MASPKAAKKAGKCYRGVVKAADDFMARWHRAAVEKSRLRHANEDAKKKEKGPEGERSVGGGEGGRGSQQY